MKARRTVVLALTALALLAASAALAGPNTDVIYRLYHYEGGSWVRYYSSDPMPAGGNVAGTNLWKYEYTIKNKSYASGINTAWLFFNSDNVLCSTYSTATVPTNWTIAKSGPIAPNYNWKERFRTTVPASYITMGNELDSFTIEFTWICSAMPGAQNYDAITSGGSESSVTLEEAPVPVEDMTWGAVKTIYR